VNVECLQRELIVSRRENHVGLASDQIEHLEAIQFRHLYVGYQQVRLVLGHGLHGFEAVRALRHDLDAFFAAQEFAQQESRRLLIVDDGDAHHAAAPVPACSTGIERETLKTGGSSAVSARTDASPR
jgi:hypothetical protein